MSLSLEQPKEEQTREVLKVFWVTLWLNLLVAAGKLLAGFSTLTLSLIADGFHSVLDASSNVAGIISIRIANKPPDADHPYGHRKFEAMGSMVISFFLFLASVNIFKDAMERFINPEAVIPQASWLSYTVILMSMAISFGVSRYERRKSEELDNDLLYADSEHTMSDVYNSISVLIAVIAIQLGYAWVDIIVAVVIVLLIFKAGYGIIMTHIGSLVDEAVLDSRYVEKLVLQVPGVLSCHKIRSRGMRNNVFIDLHVQVNPSMTVKDAHQIAYAVENKLKSIQKVRVVDVLVHIEEARPIALD